MPQIAVKQFQSYSNGSKVETFFTFLLLDDTLENFFHFVRRIKFKDIDKLTQMLCVTLGK